MLFYEEKDKQNKSSDPSNTRFNIIEFHYNNATNKAALLSLWSLYIEVVKMSFSFNKNSGITWEIELWAHWVCNTRNVRRWSRHVNHFHFNNSQLVTSTDGEIQRDYFPNYLQTSQQKLRMRDLFILWWEMGQA